MEFNKIGWCHYTANLWWGCTAVHAGCDNCYAEQMDNRYHHNSTHWGNDKPRLEVKGVWKLLEKYQRLSEEAGEMRRVFVGSMMDIFEKPMPLANRAGELYPENYTNTGTMRAAFFAKIRRGDYPNLIFLFLTKRPGNISKYIPEAWQFVPPKNVMFGTSCSDQKTAETLIPQLLKVNGNLFLSLEPMISGIDLTDLKTPGGDPLSFTNCLMGTGFDATRGRYLQPNKISWVITGGESGPYKRQFLTDWARMIAGHCKQAEVPFFMKQVDGIRPIPDDLMTKQFPNL